MLYGLSNGVYKTWAGEQIPLDIVQITDPNFANAFYDGSRIWFGPGFETDDVIGHEWAHGYTNTMNNLIYYEDSGALNEAFSDIMGETIDILNRDTPDSVDKRMLPLDTCTTNNGYYGGIDPSFRWGMGEDVAVYGMLRDMYHPECFDHPSHFRSLLYDYYWCFDGSDGYGVHTNSGIMNKIFSTLVDGGLQELMAPTHYTVKGTKYSKGIGLLNALNLIFATYSDLAPASQFPDVAVAMETQCQLLMTGDRYVPFINDQKTMAVGPMKMHHCRKAIAIIKRAYLYDEPMDIAQCYDYCDWTDTVCT
jgi:Zn-dependent metalloprotease